MLHDTMPSRSETLRPDRRGTARRVSRHEVVVLWHNDIETAIRYPVIDRTDAGFRILCATRLTEGTTGIAANILPEGMPINRPCSVRWSRPRREGRGFEAGIRLL